MKDTHENKEPENKPKASAAKVGLIGALVASYTAAGLLFMQEPILDRVQADEINAVNDLARKAGERAGRECRSESAAANAYDAVTSLYENKLVLRGAAYMADDLAGKLSALDSADIAVRSGLGAMGSYSDAVFYKGEGKGGVLLLSSGMNYNDLTTTFMDRVLTGSEAMGPGEALVLHSEYKNRGGKHYEIVPVAAGAKTYTVNQPDNPFPSGRQNQMPRDVCKPR